MMKYDKFDNTSRLNQVTYSRYKEHSYSISVCFCESILGRNVNASLKRGKPNHGSVVMNISSDENDEMRQALLLVID